MNSERANTCLSPQLAEIELERLYAMLPKNEMCRAGCSKCCGPVAVSKTEAKRMGLDRMYTLGKGDHGDTCEMIDDVTGKCSVYENRPFTCRFFNQSFAGVFKCFETPLSGGLQPKAGEAILVYYFKFLEAEGYIMEYFDAVEKTFDLMKQREERFGWHSCIGGISKKP